MLEHFADVAKKQDVIKYPNYSILRMDPYCVHNVGINETDQPLNRTFVKISISQSKYCKLGNAHNQLFIYDWPRVPRYNVPYTPDALKQSAHRKDRDQFLEVNIHHIDFTKTTTQLPWSGAKILNVIQTTPVQAKKVKIGEMLKTQVNNDFLVTITAAEKDDLKITYNDGYQVFINEKIFKTLYELDSNQNSYFFLKNIELEKLLRLQKIFVLSILMDI